ncbi:MAG: hypothetical protein D6820_08545, partial [Lentisphaerae bacterium]
MTQQSSQTTLDRPAPIPSGGQQPAHSYHWTASIFLLLAALAFASLRYWFIPFHETDSLLFYRGICAALLDGQNWAKQAVFAHLNYPAIPVVPMLIMEIISRTCDVPAASVTRIGFTLVQTLSFVILCRCSLILSRGSVFKSLPAVLLILFISLSMPTRVCHELSPFWFCLPFIFALFYYLAKIETEPDLRSVALASLLCGFLIFCGIIGICLAILSSLIMIGIYRQKIRQAQGTLFIILLPTVYGIMVFFLANLIIMMNARFPLQQFESWLVTENAAALFGNARFLLCLAVAAILILCHNLLRQRCPTIFWSIS